MGRRLGHSDVALSPGSGASCCQGLDGAPSSVSFQPMEHRNALPSRVAPVFEGLAADGVVRDGGGNCGDSAAKRTADVSLRPVKSLQRTNDAGLGDGRLVAEPWSDGP